MFSESLHFIQQHPTLELWILKVLHCNTTMGTACNVTDLPRETQLPIFWFPVLKSLYKFILSITKGPTIWVPGLLGIL